MGSSTTSNPRLSYCCALILVLVGASAYSNSLNGVFVFDDVFRIVEDPALRSLDPWPIMAATNRPFAMYTFALNYALHEYDVWGYHLTNIAIHLSAGLLIFGLVRRILDRKDLFAKHENMLLALACAMLWIAHPLQTQAVTYIVQRLESLMALCFLGTLYAFARAQTSAKLRPAWLALSVGFCCFGMGCKEVMYAAPLAVIWLHRSIFAKQWPDVLSASKRYYAALFTTWGVLAWSMSHVTSDYTGGDMVSVEGMSPLSYLVSQSAVITHYLRLIFWPFPQALLYGWQPMQISDVVPQLLLLSFLVLATVVSIFRWPALSFLGGCFFLILAPTSSIIPIRDLAFEHRMYLPSAAVIVLLVLAAGLLMRKTLGNARPWMPAFCIALTLLTIGLILATRARNRDYLSEISLWQSNVVGAPENPDGWYNLAIFQDQARNFQAAKEAYTQALTLDPKNIRVLNNLGAALSREGNFQRAEEILERARDVDPNAYLVNFNLGLLMFNSGRPVESIQFYRAALESAPDKLDVRASLAGAYVYAGQPKMAMRESETVLQSDPRSVSALVNLACAKSSLGDLLGAEQYCRRAIECQTEDTPPSFLASAHGTLALAILDRDPQQAVQHLQLACKLEQNAVHYELFLGDLLLETRPAEAETRFRTALQREPQNTEALFGLAQALEGTNQIEAAIDTYAEIVRIIGESREVQLRIIALRQELKER